MMLTDGIRTAALPALPRLTRGPRLSPPMVSSACHPTGGGDDSEAMIRSPIFHGQPPTRLVPLLVLATGLCGCSSFQSRWDQAPPHPADGVSGRWIGTWQNTNNAHGGPLKAVLMPQGSNTFSAHFHAGWGKRSGTFRMPMRGTHEGDSFRFEGSRRILGVRIDTAGTIRPDEFQATYHSRFDTGTFTLRRPQPVPDPGSSSPGPKR